MSLGAKGFLAKTALAAQLAEVVRRVHAGLRYVDPDFAAEALAESDCPLTERELAVLRHVDDTTTAADIAREPHLSAGTVRDYISSAMAKPSARSRAEAARTARDQGTAYTVHLVTADSVRLSRQTCLREHTDPAVRWRVGRPRF